METAATAMQPVTLVVSRDVRPGREPEYHAWAHRLIAATTAFPGNLGMTVLGPGDEAPGQRTIVHHWASEEALQAWKASPAIQRLIQEADTFSTRWNQRATGLETWFTLPGSTGQQAPARWKMYLVTLLTVYALSLVFVPVLSPWMSRWPFPARQAVIALALTTTLTFVMLPLLTRLLRAWLHPDSRAPG